MTMRDVFIIGAAGFAAALAVVALLDLDKTKRHQLAERFPFKQREAMMDDQHWAACKDNLRSAISVLAALAAVC